MARHLPAADHPGVSNAAVYLAGTMLILWGAAHAAATRPVVASFGDLSVDNKRILAMEWVAEAITHVSLGALVVLFAAIEGSDGSAAALVYRTVAAALVGLGTLTALTGARTPVIWFRVCPFVLGTAAVLLVSASA
jgi:hypothetical protein